MDWVLIRNYRNSGMLASASIVLYWCGGDAFAVRVSGCYASGDHDESYVEVAFYSGADAAIDAFHSECVWHTAVGSYDPEPIRWKPFERRFQNGPVYYRRAL